MKVEQNIYLKMGWVSGLYKPWPAVLWVVNSTEAFYDVFALVFEGLNTQCKNILYQ